MKLNAPFVNPDKEFKLNAAIMLLILQKLALKKLAKSALTIDRLQIFHFLVLRPNILAGVIAYSGKSIYLSDVELFIIEQNIPTPDAYISLKKVKAILMYLGTEKLIQIDYAEKEGFTFELSESGATKVNNLDSNYFNRIKGYATALLSLQSISIPQLNERIKLVSKRN